MEPRHIRRTAIAGNAMLYVLLGIILFAALSFSFTRINRSATTMSLETATLHAQTITTYADKMNGAVQNIMLQNSCLASEINFDNASLAGYDNTSAPDNNKCDLFDRKGGGMNYEAPPDEALDAAAAAASGFPNAAALLGDYYFTGESCVTGVGTDSPFYDCENATPDDEDLVMILPWISIEVCTAINRTLGNITLLQDAGGSFRGTLKFTSTFENNGWALGNDSTTHETGCYRSTAAGTAPGLGYHFYQVLVAR